MLHAHCSERLEAALASVTVLERAARRERLSEQEFFARLMGRHESYAAAAVELGVSEATILRWRRRLGITGKRARAVAS